MPASATTIHADRLRTGTSGPSVGGDAAPPARHRSPRPARCTLHPAPGPSAAVAALYRSPLPPPFGALRLPLARRSPIPGARGSSARHHHEADESARAQHAERHPSRGAGPSPRGLVAPDRQESLGARDSLEVLEGHGAPDRLDLVLVTPFASGSAHRRRCDARVVHAPSELFSLGRPIGCVPLRPGYVVSRPRAIRIFPERTSSTISNWRTRAVKASSLSVEP